MDKGLAIHSTIICMEGNGHIYFFLGGGGGGGVIIKQAHNIECIQWLEFSGCPDFRIVPGIRYYYIFGDDAYGWSDEFSFKAAPTPGPSVNTKELAIAGEFEDAGSSSQVCGLILSRFGSWRSR